jgi:dCMP deaminase
MKWHEYFLNVCAVVAGKSKDESTKVGAVIVGPDHEIRSTGYNGFPRGVRELKDRQHRPLKYRYTEHAERNAIYQAARAGVCTNKCTLYVNSLPPCADCARAIIQAGIVEVYFACADVPERWYDDWIISQTMFKESDVICENIF